MYRLILTDADGTALDNTEIEPEDWTRAHTNPVTALSIISELRDPAN